MIDIFLLLVVGYCCFTDVRHGKIFNYITVPSVLIGIALNAWFFGVPGLKNSLLGLVIGFFILLILFYTGGIGGGDIKLLAAIGAIKGFPFILYAAFYGILAGGIMALFVMARYGILWQSLKNIFSRFYCLVIPGLKYIPLDKEESHTLPYGVAIALGTVWALLLLG